MFSCALTNITEELAYRLLLLGNENTNHEVSFTSVNKNETENILLEVRFLAQELPRVVKQKLEVLGVEDKTTKKHPFTEKVALYHKEIESLTQSNAAMTAKMKLTDEERAKLIFHLEERLRRLSIRTEQVLSSIKASGDETRNKLELDDLIPHKNLCEKLALVQSCYEDLCQDNRTKEEALATTKRELLSSVTEWTLKLRKDAESAIVKIRAEKENLRAKECELAKAREDFRVLHEEYVAIMGRKAKEEAERLAREEETRRQDAAARAIQRAFRRWLLRRFIRRKRRKKKGNKTRLGENAASPKNDPTTVEVQAQGQGTGQNSLVKNANVPSIPSEGIRSVVVRQQRVMRKSDSSKMEEEGATKPTKGLKEQGCQTDGRVPKTKQVFKS